MANIGRAAIICARWRRTARESSGGTADEGHFSVQTPKKRSPAGPETDGDPEAQPRQAVVRGSRFAGYCVRPHLARRLGAPILSEVIRRLLGKPCHVLEHPTKLPPIPDRRTSSVTYHARVRPPPGDPSTEALIVADRHASACELLSAAAETNAVAGAAAPEDSSEAPPPYRVLQWWPEGEGQPSSPPGGPTPSRRRATSRRAAAKTERSRSASPRTPCG